MDTFSPKTVGSISSLEALQAIDSDHTPQFDILEIRLDGFQKSEGEDALWVALRVKSWGIPILITCRAASEGGIIDLTVKERCARLERFAEVASYVDIEISSYEEMRTTAKGLQSRGIALVLSYHNFKTTPNDLKAKLQQALAYDADISKFAVMHNSTDDLKTCADFIQSTDHPVALMGMGDLAPVSRLLYAQLGSVLNYGYLGDTPTAPGQWSSLQLKQAIENSARIS